MLSYPHLSFHTLHFTLSIYFLYIFLNFSLINDKIRFEAIISILAFIQVSTILLRMFGTHLNYCFFWLNIDFMHTELLACRIFSNKKSISSACKCDLLLFIYDNQDPFEKESCTSFMGMAWLLLVHNFSA